MSIHPPLANDLRAGASGGARTSPVLRQGLACAALLGALMLCAAAAWRIGGRAPAFADVLEGVDIALWLAALLLVPRFEQNLNRLLIHNPPLSARLLLSLSSALEMAEAGLALGLAALAMLAAFPAGAPIARLETIEGISLAIPLGAYLVIVLLLAAPAVVLISGTALFAARRLAGTGYGTLLWGAAALAAHATLLGARLQDDTYTTLGGYSSHLLDMLDGLANQAYSGMFLLEIVSRILAAPMIAAAVALAALAAVQLLANGKSVSLPVSWTAASISTGAVAAYSLVQTWLWSVDPALRYPGGFENLALIGLSVALTLRLLGSWADGQPADPGRFNKEMLWLMLTGLGWIVLTEPAVRAGQASQAGILVYCLSCLLLLAGGAAIIEWIARVPAAYRWLVVPLRIAFLFLLAVPLGPQLQPLARLLPDFMERSAFIPEEAPPAWLFALCLVALTAFAWLALLPSRTRRIRRAARGGAAG